MTGSAAGLSHSWHQSPFDLKLEVLPFSLMFPDLEEEEEDREAAKEQREALEMPLRCMLVYCQELTRGFVSQWWR